MEDMKKEVAGKSRAEEMKEKYGKVYRVGATIEVDDETEKTVEFYFKRPKRISRPTLRSSRPWRSPSARSCSGCWASLSRQI